ncbi:unnamed protein product [Ceutorhynchus assimilis]|uniref:Uncharacterized protein n=1 Tax=Ceutorhynchus assimilis TaxID=467358 RepID=A0A9N9MQ73_9CUCU|nr:unnamed protein product [Ceutorhynchus assimilis]
MMNHSAVKTSVMLLDYMYDEHEITNISSSDWLFNKSFEGLDYGPLTEGSAAKGSNSDLPAWIQAAWFTVFATMIFIATGGNCIVIWIVTGTFVKLDKQFISSFETSPSTGRLLLDFIEAMPQPVNLVLPQETRSSLKALCWSLCGLLVADGGLLLRLWNHHIEE